jgi:hypothetical protein
MRSEAGGPFADCPNASAALSGLGQGTGVIAVDHTPFATVVGSTARTIQRAAFGHASSGGPQA